MCAQILGQYDSHYEWLLQCEAKHLADRFQNSRVDDRSRGFQFRFAVLILEAMDEDFAGNPPRWFVSGDQGQARESRAAALRRLGLGFFAPLMDERQVQRQARQAVPAIAAHTGVILKKALLQHIPMRGGKFAEFLGIAAPADVLHQGVSNARADLIGYLLSLFLARPRDQSGDEQEQDE